MCVYIAIEVPWRGAEQNIEIVLNAESRDIQLQFFKYAPSKGKAKCVHFVYCPAAWARTRNLTLSQFQINRLCLFLWSKEMNQLAVVRQTSFSCGIHLMILIFFLYFFCYSIKFNVEILNCFNGRIDWNVWIRNTKLRTGMFRDLSICIEYISRFSPIYCNFELSGEKTTRSFLLAFFSFNRQ